LIALRKRQLVSRAFRKGILERVDRSLYKLQDAAIPAGRRDQWDSQIATRSGCPTGCWL